MRTGSKKSSFAIGLILAVALAWMTMLLTSVGRLPLARWHEWDQSDMYVFAEQARLLASGDWLARNPYHPYHIWMQVAHPAQWSAWYGESVFYQAPLYSYFLAAGQKTHTDPIQFARMIQAVAVGLIAILMFLMTRRMFGRASAIASGLIVAVYGPLLMIATQPLKEPLALLLTLTALYALTRWIARPRAITALWIGLGLGVLATLHEGTPAIILSVICIAFLRARNRARNRSLVPRLRSGYCMVCIVLGMLVGFSPLLIRNLSVGASPFAVSTRSSITWALANEASALNGGVTWSPPNRSFVDMMNAAQHRPFGIVRGTIESYHGQWWRFFAHWAKRAVALFSGGEAADNTCYAYFRLYVPILALSLDFRWILPLAAMGVARGRPRRWLGALRSGSSVSMILIYFILLTVALSAVFPLGRLRLFLLPALAPLAGRGLIGLIAAIRNRRLPRAAILLAFAAAIFLAQKTIDRAWSLGDLRPADFNVAARIHATMGRPDLANEELARAAELLKK